MKLAWHVGVTEDGDGRLPKADDLWKVLEDYACMVVGPDATVKLRFSRFPSLSTQPYLGAVHSVLLAEEALQCEREGFDGLLLGAATDSGLDEVRSIASIPVVASIESALRLSGFVGRKVGVVTIGGMDTQNAYAGAMMGNVIKYHLQECLLKDRPVRPIPLPWADFYAIFSDAVAGNGAEFLAAFDKVTSDFYDIGAEVIVCGNQFFGGVLHHLGRRAQTSRGIPYIDNAAAGLHMLKSMVALGRTVGLRKSDVGSFRPAPEAAFKAVPSWLHDLHNRAGK